MLPDAAVQIPECLQLDGQNLPLVTLPLASWRPPGGAAPAFAVPHAALRRGYVGHWSVVGQRLELRALYGRLADGRAASLAALFPGSAGGVAADWYSGTLRVPLNAGHAWTREGRRVAVARELLLDVDRGVVVRRREHARPASDAANDAEPAAAANDAATAPGRGVTPATTAPGRPGPRRA